MANHSPAEEVNAIAYRDILMNTILGLVMAMAVLVMSIQVKKAEATAQSEPQGNLNVAITWPAGDYDVDLWVDGPGEPVPIGYSSRTGRLWNLLRDDLGNYADATDLNYESASTRGVVPGAYTFNVMCFRCPVLPVPVDLEITLNKDAGKKGEKSPAKVIFVGRTVLNKQGQERTAISFRMNAEGEIDASSMNSIFKPLRSAKKG